MIYKSITRNPFDAFTTGTSVVGLLFFGSPPHVVRLVVAIIVDSINRKTWVGTLPDGGKDVIKKYSVGVPAFAHFDSYGSVIFVCVIIWIIATSPNSLPGFVERMTFFIFGFGMAMGWIASLTSATMDLSALEVAAPDNIRIPTITLTKPQYMAFLIFSGWTSGYEPAKTYPKYIEWSVAHDGLPERLLLGSSGVGVSAPAPLRICATKTGLAQRMVSHVFRQRTRLTSYEHRRQSNG